LTARAALLWLDKLVILNHASTDGTAMLIGELMQEYPGRIAELFSHDRTWDEMTHRTWMLTEARQLGATHVAILDADELLTGNLPDWFNAYAQYCGRFGIREHPDMPPHSMLELPQICLRGDIDRMHANGVWAEQHTPVVFADDPLLKWANAPDGYAHHHRTPSGRPLQPFRPVRRSEGGLMHLQFLDDRRLRAKQALYKLQEVLRWPGRNTAAEINRQYGYAVYGYDVSKILGAAALAAQHRYAEVPAAWWEPYRALLRHLHPEAEPWQLAECRKLWAEHGAGKFAGLDLFGVVG
jgi:hypothetical protein